MQRSQLNCRRVLVAASGPDARHVQPAAAAHVGRIQTRAYQKDPISAYVAFVVRRICRHQRVGGAHCVPLVLVGRPLDSVTSAGPAYRGCWDGSCSATYPVMAWLTARAIEYLAWVATVSDDEARRLVRELTE